MHYRCLALVCAILMLAPQEARAVGVQTGAGFVAGDCRQIGDSDEKACYRGGRFDLGLNWTLKAEDDPAGPSLEQTSVKPTRVGVSSGWNLGGDGDALAALVVILLVVLVIFGIVWVVASLASKRMTLGIYGTYDYQAIKLDGTEGTSIEKYHSRSVGLQALFYLIRETDVVLSVGIAGTSARIETSSDADGDGSYALSGYSSKVGLGYVPFERSGMYGMLEFGGTFFNGTSLSKYVEDKVGRQLPQVRHSTALVLGYAF
jgi:hypothetical protein